MESFAKAVLAPFPMVMSALGITLAIFWRTPSLSRARLTWLTSFYALLFLWCWPPLSYLLVGTLEWSFPPNLSRPSTAAIVVLSGWFQPPNGDLPEGQLGSDTLSRCCQAVRLYHRTGPCLVIVSGGKVDAQSPGPTLGEAMKEFLIELGLPPERLVAEEKSRNTWENAQFTSEVLRERSIPQIVLVTEAIHLRRAVRCFEAQGLKVIPCGVDYRATDFDWRPSNLLPSAGAANTNQEVIHEWLGFGWYWLNGRM